MRPITLGGAEWALWLVVYGAVLVWSAIAPYDRFTWFLEILPALVVLGLLLATQQRFPLTRLLYWLVLLHAALLMIGGHYTYARVPMGDWLREAFELSRNHYDRVGHLFQGFGPAIAIREILIRLSPLPPGWWLRVITVCVCLAVSAVYELLEALASVVAGEDAEAFLALQGDPLDTQADMALALAGALLALATLSQLHDRSLARAARLQERRPR